MDSISEIKNESINSIIGASSILKIVLDSEKFIQWALINYPKENINTIFFGYKFFLESAIGAFAASIEYDRSLEISEDYVYSRARFRGVDLNKLPITCEKTAMLKYIQKKLRLIKQTSNFDQIKKNNLIFSNDVLTPFTLIINNHCKPISSLSFEDSVRFSMIYSAQIDLSNFEHWIPQGFLLSPFRIRGNPPLAESHKDKFKKEFLGYKLTLQYLWNSLLGEKYNETSLVNLNKATDWTQDTPLEPFSNKEYDKEPRTDLDTIFSIIETEIMKPLEKECVNLRQNNLFRLDDSFQKTILGQLLSYQENLSLTLEEQLDYTFLWYDIELLDASRNAIFNGVPAFVTLLVGAAEAKQKYGNSEKAVICKFTHPGNAEKNTYSYGVLIESGGDTGLTDYSGWLLCYDCCNDFTGFSGSGHRIAEEFIDDYLAKDLIYLRNWNIDERDLQKYLANNTTSGTKRDLVTLSTKLAEFTQKSAEIIGEAKGLLIEFITYYTLSKEELGIVDWNIQENGEQLDVIINGESFYKLVECNVNSNQLDPKEEIITLRRKLQSYKGAKQKIGQFWFYYEPSLAFYKKFKELQEIYSNEDILIEDYVVISHRIKEHKIWRNKKTDKIKNIFNERVSEVSISNNNSYHNYKPSIRENCPNNYSIQSIFKKISKILSRKG
jgi:hypothetical protein